MSLQEQFFSFIRKYGEGAKFVAKSVLSVAAPGSGVLIDIVEKACDTAQRAAHDRWEEDLLQLTHSNAADLQRLGAMLALLQGDLAKLCDTVIRFADQPDEMENIVRRALASDPSLLAACGKLDDLAWQCGCVVEQNRRLLDGQDEMLPILRRLNRVADFVEECLAARLKPRDLAVLLQQRQHAVAQIQQRQTDGLDPLLLELRTALPSAASVCLLEAGVAVVEHDFPGVQKALGTAVKLKPSDGEIVELHRRATVLATNATPHQPRAKPSVPRPQVGDVLDGWHLEARCGSGGWGQVFKATQAGQTRALKIMHPEYARDAVFVARFREEIKALLRLPRHDNLVQIIDFNKTDSGAWYLIMEYIDGPTLEKYLEAKGPLSAELVRKVFAPVAEGLAKVHELGLVHRDIKPGNLIFREREQLLVLVDFGLAIASADAGQTKLGGMTVLFAAPEQTRGEPATVCSDVFSLAATMNFAMFHDKPNLRVPHRFDVEQVPEMLRAVMAKGMEQNPDKRYPQARALLLDLVPAAMAIDEVKNTASVPPGKPGAKSTAANLAPGLPGVRPGTVSDSRKIGDTITNALGMKFAWVPPGCSWLGGGGGTPGTKEFTLKSGLWCGVCQVTQAEWKAVMDNNPSRFAGNPRYPTETVSWDDVQEFLKMLDARLKNDGLVYRLLTEDEWEYICRGGPLTSPEQSKYHFYFAKSKTDLTPAATNDLSSQQANFHGSYPAGSAVEGPYLERSCEVGSYLPNPLGIYDMHGNVWEWTSSVVGSNRVSRGGSWYNRGSSCRAAFRSCSAPSVRDSLLGFRLVCSSVVK